MLHTVTVDPWNAEAPLSALRAPCTPTASFYVRNNFVPPMIEEPAFRLRVHGAVAQPLVLDIDAIRALPRIERRVTLECAGNGRLLLDPPAPGTQWHLGAAGTAVFAGARLAYVLAAAGVSADAVECVFTGADSGAVPERGVVPFQRSLPIDIAHGDDPILAWEMNGAPLMRDHGHPLRLVVPGWYAVASVKWLVDIELVTLPFQGHFQVDRYVYRKDDVVDTVSTMRVRALVTAPDDGAAVPDGTCRIEGVAWSGARSIVHVEVCVDEGEWLYAELDDESRPAEAVGWSIDVVLPQGPHTIRARATDAGGATQPLEADWNERGYGNNVVHSISVTATPAAGVA